MPSVRRPSDWTPAQVKSFLEEYNSHMLQILTIHEGYPGHYVQLAYANADAVADSEGLSIRPVCRRLGGVWRSRRCSMKGMARGDLRLRLMQQKFYLRAVANAILDHRYALHASFR